MRFSRGTSLIGAAVAVVGATALVGVGGIASAAPHSGPTQPTGYVARAVPTETAYKVGTTELAFGGIAGGGTATTGSTVLPATVPAGQQPHTPDVGDHASATTTKHSSLSRTSLKANPIDPTVAGQTVSGPTANLSTSIAGSDAYDQGVTHPVYSTSTGAPESLPGVDIEPPDQGICAGNGYVMEINNMVAKVFSSDLSGGSQAAPIESLFDTPEIFGAANDGSYSIQGDPRCFYDAASGRWFASQLWLDENDATSFGWAGTFVAVSTSGSPKGTWNDYFIPDAYNATGTATCNNVAATSTNPAPNPCFGDQPLLGIDGASVQISTNEYSINNNTPNGPAGLYFLSKREMVNGAASVKVLFSAVGATVAVPASNGPWYSLAPAQAPDANYDSANNGTSYALSALDFASTGDNRIAEWAYTNTGAVAGSGSVNIYELTLNSGNYAVPPLPTVAQETGSVPLAINWNRLNGAKKNTPLPEGGIATNDDRMTSVTVDPSNGALIGALNTGVNQPRSGSTSATLGGVAYFVVTPDLGSTGLTATPVTTGYIAPAGASAVFPAVAVTSSGAGVINYTLVGSSYYPSQAYTVVSAGDSVGTTVHVARLGAGPQDGFSEYQSIGTSLYAPRWGDYGAAVATGSTITFANEMINQTCTSGQFTQDFTCGSTRDLFANWGTGIATLNEG